MNEAFNLRGGISSVLYAEGVYYAFGAEKNSLVRFRSTDLIRWEREKEIYRGKKAIGCTAALERNGRIYLLFSCGGRVLLAMSDRTFGEFEMYPRTVIAKCGADLSVCPTREGYRLLTGGDNGVRVWKSYNLIDWTYGGERFGSLGRTASPSYLPSGGREHLFFARDGETFCYSGGTPVRVEDFPLPRTAAFPDGRLILFGEKGGEILFREVRIAEGIGVYPLAERLALRAAQWSLSGLRFKKRGCLPDMPNAPAEYAVKIELGEDAERFCLSFFESPAGGINFHYNAAEEVAVFDAGFVGGGISARKLQAGKTLELTLLAKEGIIEIFAGGASFSSSVPSCLKGRGMSVRADEGEISVDAFRIKKQEE